METRNPVEEALGAVVAGEVQVAEGVVGDEEVEEVEGEDEAAAADVLGTILSHLRQLLPPPVLLPSLLRLRKGRQMTRRIHPQKRPRPTKHSFGHPSLSPRRYHRATLLPLHLLAFTLLTNCLTFKMEKRSVGILSNTLYSSIQPTSPGFNTLRNQAYVIHQCGMYTLSPVIESASFKRFTVINIHDT